MLPVFISLLALHLKTTRESLMRDDTILKMGPD